MKSVNVLTCSSVNVLTYYGNKVVMLLQLNDSKANDY